MRRAKHVPRYCDLPDGLVQCYRCDLRRPGFLPWRPDMPWHCDLRDEHVPRRCNLQRLLLVSGLHHLHRQLDLSRQPDLLLGDIGWLVDLQRHFDLFRIHADMWWLRTDVHELADLHGSDYLRKHPDVRSCRDL